MTKQTRKPCCGSLVVIVITLLIRSQTITGGMENSNATMEVDTSQRICNENLSSLLPTPYSEVEKFECARLWNTFVLRYHKEKNNVVTFIMSAEYAKGWVAMGFSRDGGMVGSSAMVGWVNSKGNARIKQYSLKGTKPSEVLPNAGDLALTNAPHVGVIHRGMIYMAYQIYFQNELQKQPIILALGKTNPKHYRLAKHDDQASIVFDFSAGSATALGRSVKTKGIHGITGTFAWGVILPTGVLVARYMKQKDPAFYYVHVIIQFVGFVFCVATIVMGQRLYSETHAAISTHRTIGYLTFALVVLQVLAFFFRPGKEAGLRRYWNWYHHWFGRIAILLGLIDVLIGISLSAAGNVWRVLFGLLVSLLLIIFVVLEMVRSNDTNHSI